MKQIPLISLKSLFLLAIVAVCCILNSSCHKGSIFGSHDADTSNIGFNFNVAQMSIADFRSLIDTPNFEKLIFEFQAKPSPNSLEILCRRTLHSLTLPTTYYYDNGGNPITNITLNQYLENIHIPDSSQVGNLVLDSTQRDSLVNEVNAAIAGEDSTNKIQSVLLVPKLVPHTNPSNISYIGVSFIYLHQKDSVNLVGTLYTSSSPSSNVIYSAVIPNPCPPAPPCAKE